MVVINLHIFQSPGIKFIKNTNNTKTTEPLMAVFSLDKITDNLIPNISIPHLNSTIDIIK